MGLTTVSVLRTIEDPVEADRLWYASLEEITRVATQQFGAGQDFTVRDLLPSDMPGQANNDAVETSGGTDNAYDTTTQGDGTAIADDTVMLINGVSIPTVQAANAAIVTALRITVGASLRSQVSLYPILSYGTEAQSATVVKKGWFMTPVVITKNQILTIAEYVTTLTTAYELVLYGLIAEVEGRVVGP